MLSRGLQLQSLLLGKQKPSRIIFNVRHVVRGMHMVMLPITWLSRPSGGARHKLAQARGKGELLVAVWVVCGPIARARCGGSGGICSGVFYRPESLLIKADEYAAHSASFLPRR